MLNAMKKWSAELRNDALALRNRRMLAKAIACGMLALLIAGLVPLPAEAMPRRVAVRTGVTVRSNDKASVDISNLAEGFVIVRYTGGRNVSIKAQVTKRDGVSYTYDINNRGNPEVIPLTEGNGRYTVVIFENIQDNRFAQAFNVSLDLTLRNEFLPFLYPNQYVNFREPSPVAEKAAELAKGKDTQLATLQEIYHFVVGELTYDTDLAKNVRPGYIPDVNAVLERKKGICFDYAALMASMLRLQGIPCKLVIGYAGSLYHAWINVYIEDIGWIDRAIFFDGERWSLMDPTFVSTSRSANAVSQFVGEGNDYTQKYAY